jgi:hypothetical protein
MIEHLQRQGDTVLHEGPLAMQRKPAPQTECTGWPAQAASLQAPQVSVAVS